MGVPSLFKNVVEYDPSSYIWDQNAKYDHLYFDFNNLIHFCRGAMKPKTEEEKSAYNLFHRLVFNIKKLINKAPGGKSKIASYAAGLLLLKEHLNLSDETLEKMLDEMGLDTVDFLEESNQWFVAQDYMLSPGEYKLAVDNKVISSTVEEITKKNDKVFVEENNYPVTNLFGVDIYEVIHTPTHQKIYVTAGELNR